MDCPGLGIVREGFEVVGCSKQAPDQDRLLPLMNS